MGFVPAVVSKRSVLVDLGVHYAFGAGSIVMGILRTGYVSMDIGIHIGILCVRC